MSVATNAYGQPVGASLPEWSERPLPSKVTLEGTYCRLEPLDVSRHGDDLYLAWSQAADGRDWTYMFCGPFDSREQCLHYLAGCEQSQDPRHFAVIDRQSGNAVGSLALMRQEPKHGVVEVGHVAFSPLLKRSPLSTEAQFLLMRYVFEQLGYRRYEWKCDTLNGPSRNAAQRLGFSFEGVFRQAIVYKGRTRDTAWFSLLDSEWPLTRDVFTAWLSPDNFDADGLQKTSLVALRAKAQ